MVIMKYNKYSKEAKIIKGKILKGQATTGKLRIRRQAVCCIHICSDGKTQRIPKITHSKTIKRQEYCGHIFILTYTAASLNHACSADMPVVTSPWESVCINYSGDIQSSIATNPLERSLLLNHHLGKIKSLATQQKTIFSRIQGHRGKNLYN